MPGVGCKSTALPRGPDPAAAADSAAFDRLLPVPADASVTRSLEIPMLSRLAKAAQLEPDELRRALLLGGLLFALTGSYTLVKTARDALFLSTLPATTLPWVFLGVGALSLVATVLFTLGTERKSATANLAAGALVTAVVLGAFAWIVQLGQHWTPVAFYLWVNLYGLILMAQFWIFTSAVSNPREAKRTFGLIGTGGVLGGLTGGLLAAPLVNTFGLAGLVVAGAAVTALLGWGALVVSRRRSVAIEPVPGTPGPVPRPLQVPYVRWLALAALCSVIVSGLLDFSFKLDLQQRYAGGATLASFLGAFYTFVNLASLFIQLFTTRWALQVLGAGWSAAVLPSGLGLLAVVHAVIPGFGIVVSARLWDQVLRNTLNRSAGELFYFPLEPALRRRARAFISAGLERLADGLAGICILVLGMFATVSGVSVMALAGALVLVWVGAWLKVRAGYVAELGHNLKRMNLGHGHETVSLREASLLKEISNLLGSRAERVVLHGMLLLEENAPEVLEERLPSLLEHRSAAVRARALEVAGMRRLTAHADRVRAMLEDAEASVRVAALRAHGLLSGDRPIDAVEGFLDSPEARMRAAAIQILIEFSPPEDEYRVRAQVDRMIESGSAEERSAVAAALGRRPGPSALHDLLTPLLEDVDLDVRRAALRSAGPVQRRNHIPALLEALRARRTRDAARDGLAAWGDRAVGTLGDYLCDSTVAHEIRHAIPLVLTDISTQEAVNALLRCREARDVRLRYRVLKALNRVRASGAAVTFPRAQVTQDIEIDARSGMFAYVHYRACPVGGTSGAERLFCLALNERVDQSLNRVFRRLALLYPAEEILASYRGVTSEDARARGSALEFLENALAPDHRALVLPMVDDSGDEGRLRFAEQRFGLRYESFDESLRDIISGEDQWLRTCALFVVGARRQRALLPSVMEALSALDTRVRETANWATLAIAGGT